MPNFFAHFPSATTVDFPDAFYENPIYQVASSYAHIKHCIMRTSDHLHNARVPLSALRELEYVHIYQPHPAEIARAVDHIPSPLSLVVSPDLDNPDDDFEIAIADSHKRLARWRFIIDQTARWSREHHPESTLRDALHAALAGKVFDLYADAAYWPTLVQVLPQIAGLQVVQLQVSRDDDLAALSPAAFASGSLHMLSLTSKACLVVPANKLVAFASGSFGAHVPRLALANIHLEGDLGALRACFGEFEFMHGAPCGCLPPRSDSATGFIE